ncbi:MAG: aminotransferase [Chthoniobacteraceae bacterium]|nr:aminotransferase [Chthoniobacteraceae bacterium]
MSPLLCRPPAISSTRLPIAPPQRFSIAAATLKERDRIYQIRHEVYADEIHQHAPNENGRLHDALDQANVYLVAKWDHELCGFISVTPPAQTPYSVEKYLSREALDLPDTSKLHEIRLLTVRKPWRGSEVATLLMYAAFRWVESHGGEHIVAIGRHELLDLYLRLGLERGGSVIQSGAVTYHLLARSVRALREHLEGFENLMGRLEEKVDWKLPFGFRKPVACFHGGGFFNAIGPRFDHLERSHAIINADVLDAWFPPSPKVLAAVREYLPWLARTSPPTACEGLVEVIAQTRGVNCCNILPGSGSSDLIFRALRHWLTPASRVLVLDPTYGEYVHVLEQVIGCTVDRFLLSRSNQYEVDMERLEAAFAVEYDLVVLVNPNSPTGRYIPRDHLVALLKKAPFSTRIWVDETYIEYIGAAQSLEPFAARSENVIVCKSMSKVYALSGLRAAYLCAGAHQLEALRSITPPWVVSLPAQMAAVEALLDPSYYQARYNETDALRLQLKAGIEALGWDIVPGCANFLLCHLPVPGPSAAQLVEQCRPRGLYLRDAAAMSSQTGSDTIRIAVKDAETNARMLGILTGFF